MGKDEEKKAARRKKLYVRGCFTNGLGLAILFAIAKGLDLYTYAGIALGLQYAVFFLHGMPFNSEKFYDLSGSLTHFSVVASSMYLNYDGKAHPVKLFASIVSFIWMIRLGSFLYARILKDKKDERFDHIKTVWWSFMGAWTLQVSFFIVLLSSLTHVNTNIGRLGSHHSTSRCASEHVRTVLGDLEYVSIRCNGRMGSRISDRSLGRFTKVCISKDSRESPQVHHIRFVALLTSSELLW